MSNKLEEIKALVANLEADGDKFYDKKNGAAGTRLRADFQRLKVLAQEARTEVTEIKNARKEG